ncbi:MAG TPA: hypothetical protein VMT15_11785 [Bryobacteraceae bacterium]|nr:hypothetical protein [Bryobacteraceae bacterium]
MFRTLFSLIFAPAIFATLGLSQCAAQDLYDEDFHVFTDAPRLLLTKQRLRLLQRERERQSMRWQQFDALVSGGAPMPEQGLAWAFYYQVAKNQPAGRKAVEWALDESNSDPRQLALIFDWCAPLMTKSQADRIAGKIEKVLAGPPPTDVSKQTARALATIALADTLPDQGEAVLKQIVQQWWRRGLAKNPQAIPREETYPLYELMHVLRDNLKIDLREGAHDYFKGLPTDHLVGHYPAPFEAPENEYRVPVYVRDGEPNLTDAVFSRAAELAMVAYDNNALESQYLQGWLMQDRFLMRGALGALYEFLWANPYQPGLSYFQMPLIFHDAVSGHVFARSSWDENAVWIGYFDGHLQLFRDGHIESLRPGASFAPVRIGDAVLMRGADPEYKFRADAEAIFILGLTPNAWYDVEIDDEELSEARTDSGGALVIALPPGQDLGARVRKR